MKKIRNKLFRVIVFATLTFVMFTMWTITFDASAKEMSLQSNFEITDGCFDHYTDSDSFYNSNTKLPDPSKKISGYPDYFFKRFYNNYYEVTDDWILGFVPEELFINPGQYFYVGKQNGFFVDNNGTT